MLSLRIDVISAILVLFGILLLGLFWFNHVLHFVYGYPISRLCVSLSFRNVGLTKFYSILINPYLTNIQIYERISLLTFTFTFIPFLSLFYFLLPWWRWDKIYHIVCFRLWKAYFWAQSIRALKKLNTLNLICCRLLQGALISVLGHQTDW